MTIDTGDNFNITYCLICDSSLRGGENSFLKGLGELQKNKKVELKLETCKCEDAPKNMLWRISYKH